jgi:hypothetical protein
MNVNFELDIETVERLIHLKAILEVEYLEDVIEIITREMYNNVVHAIDDVLNDDDVEYVAISEQASAPEATIEPVTLKPSKRNI